MLTKRKLNKVYTPRPERGFLGPDHIARPVVLNNFAESDPFILLMDDMLDKQTDEPVGGPHPHAGFETVTLILEGELGDEEHTMKKGDFQMMTAGSGIIHTETIERKTKMRLLQLWLALPKNERWATPRIQDVKDENVPTVNENGVKIKLYSGTFAGSSSPVLNHAPVIIADIQIQSGKTTIQEIPGSFNTFFYVIEGSLRVGEDVQELKKDQVGWLNRLTDNSPSELKLTAGESGTHVIMYSGQPQGDNLVAHGPFIADSTDDISRLYKEYRQGKMKHISTVPESQKLKW